MKRRWIYTGVCLTALAGLYLSWWLREPPANLPAALASLIVTALFALLGIIFIPQWIKAWSGDGDASASVQAPEKKVFFNIFLALLFSRLLVFVITFVFRLLQGGLSGGFYSAFLDIWTYGDSFHYIDIAERWYQSTGSIHEVVRLVFLPFYPILIRLFSLIFKSAFVSGLIVSQLSFSVAGYVLYRLARLDMGHSDAIKAVKCLVLIPSAFFYTAPMSDSLFLLLSLSCVYFARRKRYLPACLLGGLAAFTRSLGVTLLAPVCFELIADIIRLKRSGKLNFKYVLNCLCVIIIPLGFAAYLYVNYLVSGNPFQYTIYQYEHWGQKLGFFFNTASYQMYCAIASVNEDNIFMLLGLWLPNIIFMFSSLVIMCLAAKRLRASYVAYFIAYFCVALGTTWLLSGPRYLASLFPLSIALSTLTKSKRSDLILTSVFIIGSLLYMWAYVGHWQVY